MPKKVDVLALKQGGQVDKNHWVRSGCLSFIVNVEVYRGVKLEIAKGFGVLGGMLKTVAGQRSAFQW